MNLTGFTDVMAHNINKCDFFYIGQRNVSKFGRSVSFSELIFSKWPMYDVNKIMHEEKRSFQNAKYSYKF